MKPKAKPVAVADLPALVFHEHEEVAQVVSVLDSRVQIRFQHGAEGGLALGLAQPFDSLRRSICRGMKP